MWLNILQLAFVSLMPFSCALIGEKGVVLSQAIYSVNMAMLAVTGLLIARHVQRHRGLGPTPMPLATYRAARLRIAVLIVISAVAVLLTWIVPWPGAGNMAFMLMAVITPLSRRMEQRELAGEVGSAADPAR